MFTALPCAVAGEGHTEAVAFSGIDIFQNRLFDQHLEISVVLIQAADADFEIFVQLVAIVGLGQHRDFREVQRNCVRTIMTHGADNLAVAEGMIAGELDMADLDLGAFFNFENENDGVAGSDSLVLRSDFGELPAVLAEQFLAGPLPPS